MADEGAQVRLRSKIDPPCPRHPDTEAIFVCQGTDCNEALTCPKCIVGGGYHRGHDLTLFQDLLDTFKAKVTDFNKTTRGQVLDPFKQMSEKVATELAAYEGATSNLLKEIEKRGDQLHLQIDELVNEYKQKCRQLRSSNFQVLEQYQRDLLAKIAEVEEDITSLEDCIQSTCKADIMNAAKTGISKTYRSIDYPTDVKVSFQQSELPLQDMDRYIGRILIGNEQPEREETDEVKNKRLEAKIQELSQRQESDEDKIKGLESKIQDLTKRQKRDEANTKQMESRIQELTKTEQSALARIQRLQSDNNELTRKLQEQERDSERSVQKQKTPGAQRDLCSVCGEQKKDCRCKKCPECSYKGIDFRLNKYYTSGYSWLWRCPKCDHEFWEAL